MRIRHLVAREIRYRKVNFALAVLAAAAAVACLTGALTLLRADDVRLRRRLYGLEDDVRKITKDLGYNVLVIHADQDRKQFLRGRIATVTMPETNVDRLAHSKVMTVRHLLPTLRGEVRVGDSGYELTIMGTRDEVPLAHRDPKKPIRDAVPPGTAVLGHDAAADLGLGVGDTLRLGDAALEVTKVRPRRDNEDDYTAWVHLADAQGILGLPGRINAILALSCYCEGSPITSIRREIESALDDAQAIVLADQEAARRLARARAAEHSVVERREREAFAAWLLPVVVAGCAVGVGVLALVNVRDRRGEVGVLRAIGLGARQVFALFMAKAVVVGVVGAAVGWAIGFAVGAAWGGRGIGEEPAVGPAALFSPVLLAAMLLAAPAVTAVAGLVPAMLAARQDPAVILRDL